jgi:hypothetical protein
MEESFIQEREDMRRVKEIYDTALSQLMTGSMPILIHIKEAEVKRLSASIIQRNLSMISGDIIVYVFAIESGKEQSNYLAGLYHNNYNAGISVIDEQRIINYYELPNILEKSYKVETQSRILSYQKGNEDGKNAELSVSNTNKES